MAYYAFDSFGIFGEWNTLEIQPFFWYTNPFPLPPMCWGWYIDTVGRAFCSCASHNLWWRWIWGGDYLPQKVQIFRPPIGVAFPLQGNVKMPTSQRPCLICFKEKVSQIWNVDQTNGPILEILEHLQKKQNLKRRFCPSKKRFFPSKKRFFLVFFGYFYVVFQSMEETMQQWWVPENISWPSLTICDMLLKFAAERKGI